MQVVPEAGEKEASEAPVAVNFDKNSQACKNESRARFASNVSAHTRKSVAYREDRPKHAMTYTGAGITQNLEVCPSCATCYACKSII
jgi:hypothetical protein